VPPPDPVVNPSADAEKAATHLSVAATLIERQRHAEALEHLDEALRLQPAFPQALYNRGSALLALGQAEAALASYDAAIRLNPNIPAAFNNRGTALYRLRRFDEALRSYSRALELHPAYPSALSNCGNVLREMDRAAESLPLLSEALRLQPRHAGALSNRGHSLLRLGRLAEAAASFAEAVEVDPSFDAALGFLYYARAGVCDWTDRSTLLTKLMAAFQCERRASLPFPFLLACEEAAAQLHCAQISSRLDSPAHNTGMSRPSPYAHDRRLRVGYLSGDFRDHAVAFLMTGVLEQHDKARFEVSAISLRPPDSGLYGQRIATAVDRFLDVSRLSDAQAAAEIRAAEIDILVDLVGHTQGARPGILALRPAPLQVNYLGYPGTSGAPYVDYLIADDYLIPEGSRAHYTEQIVYLPECFQANDDRRPLNAQPVLRSEVGLPERGPVLCCFNSSFKLTPTFLDIWARLLQATPGSVLWLVAGNALTQQNLRDEAERRGVDPERVHFAPRVPYEQHLARLACADLFLDTLPFNGGTTVSDALWACVPVITCSGEAMAARMGGSLLHTLGLPELICRDLTHYEQFARDLLTDPSRLAALRTRIAKQRSRSALFNTRRFTRHLEHAYTLMHRAHQGGQAPQHLFVPPLAADL
jgi:protein O-GlcNAc transferase